MPDAAGTLPGDVFAAAVAQVAVAVGRDDTLPVLTGIRVEFEGDRLVLAATDRYRLAVRELAWTPGRTDLTTVALVQGRSLADTARALADTDSVTIALSGSGAGEGLIGFEGAADGESRRTTNRLLDGEFPKYRALLPSESSVDGRRRVGVVARDGEAGGARGRPQHPSAAVLRRGTGRRRGRRR